MSRNALSRTIYAVFRTGCPLQNRLPYRRREQTRIDNVARKLKTYQTSLGFFDQAIAAPSMKAALEAWGADSNLFHQGAAKESDDPDVIAATMAKPGIVLKRERLPRARPTGRRSKGLLSPTKGSSGSVKERARGKAARRKERERRQQAVDKAQAALNHADAQHAKRAGAIQAQAEAIEKRLQAEDAGWVEEKERLLGALQRARE